MGVYTDQDLDDLVKENLRLAKENNKLLKKIRRAEVWGFWLKVLFYAVAIGVPIFVYRTFFSGYVHDLMDTYNAVRENSAAVQQSMPEALRRSLGLEANEPVE